MSRKASKKTAPVLTCLSLMLSLLSVACGGLSPEEIDAQAEQIAVPIVATWKAGAPAPTTRPTRTPPSAPAAAPTRTPVPTKMNLAPAQVLNLALCCSGADFNTLDPTLMWGGPAVQVVTEAFVGLARQNEETSEVEPGMATSWDVSADGLVWTFQLRTDVPWVRYNPAIGRVEQVSAVGGQVRTDTAVRPPHVLADRRDRAVREVGGAEALGHTARALTDS
jgi:hypothetical protein